MWTIILLCGVWLSSALVAHADLYQWVDADGVIHVVDDAGAIPDAYQDTVKVYRAATPATSTARPAAPLSPSRTYSANSQGAFAQKIALDLGLIKHSGEDALGPLTNVGVRPAGGWQVSAPLSPEDLYEILAAARRAAEVKRLPLSADGAEAVIRQAAASFLPPPPAAQPAPPVEEQPEEVFYDEEPETVIIEQPPQVVEVIREPYYGPPIIVGVPSHPPHHRHRHKHRDKILPPPAPPTGPHTTRPGPTHLPPRANHLPPGTSHPSPFTRR